MGHRNKMPVGEPLKGHDNWVKSVAFSSNGKTLALGSHDGIIWLWDTETATAIGAPSTLMES